MTPLIPLGVHTPKPVLFGSNDENNSLHASDMLLKKLSMAARPDRFDNTAPFKQQTLKQKVIKQFLNPDKSTPHTISLFNSLRNVDDYKMFLLGQFNPKQDKFHAFLLKNLGTGAIARLGHAAKRALNMPGNTPGILTPINLNPTWSGLARYTAKLTPQEAIKASMVREHTPLGRQQNLGLTPKETDSIILSQGVDNWLGNTFKTYHPDRQAELITQSRVHYTNLLWQHEVDRLNRLRERHNIPANQKDMVVLRLSPSAAGSPEVFMARNRLEQAMGSKSLSPSNPLAAIQRFNQALSSNTPLSQGLETLKKSAEFASLKDGIIPLKPDFFFRMSPDRQVDYIQDTMERNGK
jgi:hypothetical protein